jgi:polyhydroxyalkanoate synthesis regulator phasin
MVGEALRNYLILVNGLTEVTRQRAQAAAKALVAQGGATVEQVSGVAEEILQTSRANQAAIASLVRYEIERALGRLGLATAEEVAALRRRVDELERRVRGQAAAPAEPAPATTSPAAKAGPAKKAAPKAAPAKKAAKKTAKKAPAKKAGGTAVSG